MGIIVKGSNYVPAPEGLHNVVCVDIVDLGMQTTKFGTRDTVKLVWEVDDATAGLMENGKRFTISKRYRKSLHEKSGLHKDLKSWRGRAFTVEELKAFDLDNVLHAPGKIMVQHNESGGDVFANIAVITKADKDQGLKPSGQYVRVIDRPADQQNDNGGHHDDAGAEEAPF